MHHTTLDTNPAAVARRDRWKGFDRVSVAWYTFTPVAACGAIGEFEYFPREAIDTP